jgi:hypothetical protein
MVDVACNEAKETVLLGLEGRDMAQVVSCQSFAAETQVSPRGICGGHSGGGIGFSGVIVFLSIIHCGSPISYHLRDEQLETALERQSHPIDLNSMNMLGL